MSSGKYKNLGSTNTLKNKGKNFWGPSLWKVIHIMAASYDPTKKDAFLDFIASLSLLIPCDECKRHFYTNISSVLPLKIEYLENREILFKWTYELHDLVNKQINHKLGKIVKVSPSYKDVRKIYFDNL